MIFKIKKRIAPTETKKPAFLSLSHMITQLLLLACFDQRQIAYLLTVFNLILATYENAVTYGCLVAMIALIAYGSRTIIMASMGMV